MSTEENRPDGVVRTEVRSNVLVITLSRPEKLNALNANLFDGISAAYARYEADPDLRCALLRADGSSFSVGADLTVLPAMVEAGDEAADPDRFDPFGLEGRRLSKPVVAAVHGMCLAGGLEIALAADIIVAAEGTRLGQPEPVRGLFAFGGAVIRWQQRVGWGNAQRYLLTGDLLGVDEGHRIGLVQEVVPEDQLFDTAFGIAQRIADAAPLGVRYGLEVSRAAADQGFEAAVHLLVARRAEIVRTQDVAEGLQSFMERRPGRYVGR
ncbi:crotonase/enoyl-CoA hydratase family protein [Aeromicrobium choanae]|uniref:Enoyl-CoA hydratase/carnithine racemase n=1 Tax=Aeromicrobium choanae TaxID=1736691 RepID=A0A1T4YRP4_9ACTN|nr:crotonase/enoyl-CoA hydratase family protein [Aeromicrobium choanae]SKB04524.1 Enoyl-CoA hydratase/carnithine racemase [Aeromicrobium choanae]